MCSTDLVCFPRVLNLWSCLFREDLNSFWQTQKTKKCQTSSNFAECSCIQPTSEEKTHFRQTLYLVENKHFKIHANNIILFNWYIVWVFSQKIDILCEAIFNSLEKDAIQYNRRSNLIVEGEDQI